MDCKGKSKVVPVLQRCTTTSRRTVGVEVQLHAFLISGVDGGELSASCFGSFTLGKEPLVPIE
jgi:hypothetical protein